ncbi:hypothetical protein [Candidatus Spongiihabitans sp.]|uniref:hypothetical protein n=1 Tax=Candidatus Spongiihabitans sp. TaxID=3101308 RepID=UPI003C7B0738
MNINAIMQSFNLSSWGWVAVVIAVIGVVWKISTWTTTVDNRLSGVEKIIEGLTKNVEGLTKKVDEVYRVIVMRHGRAIEKIDSPVTLSEYGQELFEKIDAEKVVDAYADKLHGDTQGMNAYKVQEQCFLFCKEKLLDDLEAKDKDQFDKISQVAFDEDIDIEKITRVVGIALRDRVLQMEGKSHTEVDEHSPNDD